jgi:hypothetical protein
LRLRIEVVGDGLYDAVLEAAEDPSVDVPLHSLHAWPVTRRYETGAQDVDLSGAALCRFTCLPLERVTPFVGFRAVLRDGGAEVTVDFVLNVPLIDAPSERRAHVLKAMLSNKAEVLRYLLYLLSGDGIDAIRAMTEMRATYAAGPKAGHSGASLPLLESLLRTLDREPAKLAAVRRLVTELRSTPNGEALLPDDWDAIWAPIDALASGVS